ncbi:uncharacterized protein C8Q71DRAFT_796153 [Rhodofomes roseus]|uniref:YMC020W-like alpha/beta hydrolase domain-containing protein n=1 Tax=Rhodofomes roseus TaxID=34475 RepID=A0ABQ8KHY2_9APHY|nr:uncharacterized protein C8Q71DRAFT_796153 [Rhodofomes roseus]KAH9837583.1 hypothetical protein C8Q71DRAFT_796153 [Rhodofomes roseus]
MGRKPSVSDLNPSTSRFTLRIPLLGRPKVPLQEAVKSAEAGAQLDGATSGRSDVAAEDDGAKDVASQLQSPANVGDRKDNDSIDPEPPSPQVSATSPPVRSPVAESSSPEPQLSTSPPRPPSDDKTPEVTDHPAHTSSWWDYVGWSHSAQSISDRPAKPDTLTVDTVKANAQAEVTTPTSPAPEMVKTASTASAPPAVGSSLHEELPPEVQKSLTTDDIENASAPARKPASILSAETAKSRNSVWYSPWAWYSMSPNPADAGSSTIQAPEATKDEEGSSEHVKTESEMVKEQALARDEQADDKVDKTEIPVIAVASDPPPPQDSALSPSAELQNPIESSITASRSGWVSFFMSKALLTKSISDDGKEKDENGMEVMDVDDEEEDKQEGPSAPVVIAPGKDQLQPRPVSPSSKASAPSARREHAHKKSIGSVSAVDRRMSDTKGTARTPSPAPSRASSVHSAMAPRPPSLKNLVLPTWEQTFLSPPRSIVPPKPQGKSKLAKMSKTISLVSDVLFSKDDEVGGKGKGKEREREAKFIHLGKELPKALDVIGETLNLYMLNGGCRVVVIGVAGWSPGAVTRTLAGGLPSSSSKFVDMTCQALEQLEQEHSFKFKKITRVPLEGDGTIERKVSKVHDHLLSNEDWMEDLHAADVILVAAHSQGSIVATHLIDRLVRDGHILTSRSVDILKRTAAAVAPGSAAPSVTQAQRIGFLALCGIHLGPLRYLGASSLLQPYIQYFEHASARELFEFQNTQSRLSKNYAKALKNVVDHGAKMVYIASLNDQVVPIYSGLFTAASHPRILRALYIDGDAYHSSDFLTNLLVLLIRILNAGLSDGGLLIHLSEATAGTLSGIGHSTVYEELATFSLAVKYFFLTTDGDKEDVELNIDSFNAVEEQNDYEIPWSLRDMIADERVAHLFAREFAQLRDAFDDWHPKTTILRDVKRKLQPIQRLNSFTPSNSRL